MKYREALKLVLSLIFVLGGMAACANKRPAPQQQTYTPRYFIHRVSAQGETLGMIARWYTGSANNWKEILNSNPGLDARRIRIGSEILIPDEMVTKRNPMPIPSQSEVRVAREAAQSKGGEQHAAIDSGTAPEVAVEASTSTVSGEVDGEQWEQQPSIADSMQPDTSMVTAEETIQAIAEGQEAFNESEPSNGSSSKLSKWLTGNIEKENSAAPAQDKAAAQAEALQQQGQDIRNSAASLSLEAQQSGTVDQQKVQEIQNQAQAIQQRALEQQVDALEQQVEALREAADKIEETSAVPNQGQNKTREELLKQLTEDY
ncbi:MAG: LysM peptidoglycan-binding domain-containing protein [Deltaproteobacteria bacterium]|nr:LysM peptidoglycan-binding domain-containing protein [Deltaproteobacteria bacterium]